VHVPKPELFLLRTNQMRWTLGRLFIRPGRINEPDRTAIKHTAATLFHGTADPDTKYVPALSCSETAFAATAPHTTPPPSNYSQSPMVGHPCGAKWPGNRCAPIFHLRQSTGTAFFRFRRCGLQRVMGWGLGQWSSRSTEWMDEVVPTGVLLAALIAGK